MAGPRDSSARHHVTPDGNADVLEYMRLYRKARDGGEAIGASYVLRSGDWIEFNRDARVIRPDKAA
jgi:hypothetical protein